MIRWLLLAVACVVMLPLQGSLDAGCHAVAIQQQSVVAYQPVAQPYYWAVGQQLQDDAKAERIANLVIQKLQTKQLNAPRKYGAPLTKQQCLDLASEYEGTAAAFPDDEPPAVPVPQTLPLTAEVDRWQLVKANCAGCHTTNEKAMAHVNMTDLSALTCEQKLAMAAAVLDSKMPPKKQLDPSVLGNLLGEIVGAESVAH